MSIDQANAFRTFVNENESVQEQIQAGLRQGRYLSELAAEHGYTFTSEEVQRVWYAKQDGELSFGELVRGSGREVDKSDWLGNLIHGIVSGWGW